MHEVIINKDFYEGIINELQSYIRLQQEEIWRNKGNYALMKLMITWKQ